MKKTLVICLAMLIALGLFVSCTYDPVEPEKPEIEEPVDPNCLVKYTFTNAEEYKAFCPRNDAGVCGDDGDTNHEAFASSFKIEDGKAMVYGNSAWLSYDKCDFDSYSYEFSYDTEIIPDNYEEITAEDDNNAKGKKALEFDSGECSAWSDAPLTIYKREGKMYVSLKHYWDILVSDAELNSTSLKVSTSFSKNDDGKVVITTTVKEGENEYKKETISSAAEISKICWDVYSPIETGGKAVASIDNFMLKQIPLEKSEPEA